MLDGNFVFESALNFIINIIDIVCRLSQYVYWLTVLMYDYALLQCFRAGLQSSGL